MDAHFAPNDLKAYNTTLYNTSSLCLYFSIILATSQTDDGHDSFYVYAQAISERGLWPLKWGTWGEAFRKLTGYVAERVTFLIILEVLLTA